MARKLTRKQQARIRYKQKKQQNKALNNLIDLNHLGQEQIGTLLTHRGSHVIVESEQGDCYACLVRQNLGYLACGDKVVWQLAENGQGVVSSFFERSSVLSRPDFYKNLKPIAANLDQLFIVIAPQPHYDSDLLNRALVNAYHSQIKTHIIFNKIDLLGSHQDLLNQTKVIYQTMGYQLFFTSTYTQQGMVELTQQLSNHTSLLIGQSGVGKSSILQTLVPNQAIQIGQISDNQRFGRHTTSNTVLYHLPQGGNLIDSPGFRYFALDHLSIDKIQQGFIEFQPYLNQCQFSNCQHLSEPNCAILKAVEQGEIHFSRYQSYHRIMGLN